MGRVNREGGKSNNEGEIDNNDGNNIVETYLLNKYETKYLLNIYWRKKRKEKRNILYVLETILGTSLKIGEGACQITKAKEPQMQWPNITFIFHS